MSPTSKHSHTFIFIPLLKMQLHWAMPSIVEFSFNEPSKLNSRQFSLERRWSSRTFRYGYLVTTSPQLPAPPSAAPSLASWVTDFGRCWLPWCDGRCVQDPGTYSPRHSDSRLLAIPASCSRVADYSPNWDVIFGICSTSLSCFPLFTPL